MPFTPAQLFIGVVAAGAVAFLSARFRLLSRSGAWATFALGSVVFGIGGIAWSVPLLTFFLTSSLLSRLGPKRKRRIEARLANVFDKGSIRDAMQVAANGGIAGLLVLAYAVHQSDVLVAAYLGALCAAAADTWATEIGVTARRTVSLPRLRSVPVGTSGGVSIPGTLAAIAGSFVVAGSAIVTCRVAVTATLQISASHSVRLFVAAGIAGVIGAFADSILGATVQARYRCPECGITTEKRTHCGISTTHIAGLRRVTNDIVNIGCCIAGAAVAAVLYAVMSYK